jgi:hypothetical protein
VIDRLRDEEHPVLTGLVALVAVGLAVGLVLGGVAVAATSVLGLGDEGSSQTASDDTDFYLPKPSPTEGPSGPLITLAPSTEEGPSESAPAEPEETEETEEAEGQITLSAGQTSVAPMEQIDLTGVYPGGEGAILQVQKFSGGAWQEFPVTAVVSNETFATFVQTSFQGVNRFRVVDNDTGAASNEVKVTVG